MNPSFSNNALRVAGILAVACAMGGTIQLPVVAYAQDVATLPEAYKLANKAQIDGDLEEQKLAWQAALQLAKSPGETAYIKLQLGKVLNTLGDFDPAQSQLQEALAVSVTPKGRVQIQTALYQSWLGLKNFGQAGAILQSLQASPNDVLPEMQKRLLGTLLLTAQGKIKEAGDETERIMWEFRENFPGMKFTSDGKFAPPTDKDINQARYGFIVGDVEGKTAKQVQTELERVANDADAPAIKREQAKVYAGDFLLYSGQPTEARSYYLDAKIKFLGAGAEVRRLSNIGDTYAMEKNWRKSLQYYQMALAVPGATALDMTPVKSKQTSVSRLVNTNGAPTP